MLFRSSDSLIDYHWQRLLNNSPFYLIGHMWALESRPPKKAIVDLLARRFYGKGLRTYKGHAIADEVHSKELEGILDLYRDDDAAFQSILEGARVTATENTRFWLSLSKYNI